ncbi:hypothetical protein KQY10_03040, partial [Leptospira interrogans]|nr:hypothetical protein [Leptospira interrogans]
KNLTILELLESSQITKCDGFCRNHCVLLKISKELSCKFFKVLGQVLRQNGAFLGLKTVQCGNYYKNLMRLEELLESSQIAKYNLIFRNYCILLKISKE